MASRTPSGVVQKRMSCRMDMTKKFAMQSWVPSGLAAPLEPGDRLCGTIGGSSPTREDA
jgi:hypothetical protein